MHAMDDDFNTADAIAAVFDLVKFANTNVAEGSSKAFAECVERENPELVRYSWYYYRKERGTSGC